MTIPECDLRELQAVCPGAVVMTEGNYTYIFLPQLKIAHGNGILVRDALLCPQGRDNYTNRLYLSEPVAGRGNNWSNHLILDRNWSTWSWNNVPADRPIVILAQHLVALR